MSLMAIAALGAIGGMNLLNMGGGFASAAQQFKYNKALQDRAFNHQINMYKHQHQWQVEDLRAAGLNPILSTHSSSGFGSAPSASVSAPDLSVKNFDQGLFSALNGRVKKENDLLDAQISSAKSAVESNLALAEKYNAEAFNTDLHSAFEFSRDVLDLKKRELYNKGTINLSQGFGSFKDTLDEYNSYHPWNKYDTGNSAFNLKGAPYRQKNSSDKYNFKK